MAHLGNIEKEMGNKDSGKRNNPGKNVIKKVINSVI